jgi:hypothetical protein
MSNKINDKLPIRLLNCSNRIKEIVAQIKKIESDQEMPAIEKISQIKIIKEELNKVGTEIDSLKKEIKLLTDYSIN